VQGTEVKSESTFEQEALPHLDTVYRVALNLSGDSDEADDLVQETMLKACRSWHRYTPGTNVRAWLLTILRNTAIDLHHRGRRRKATADFAALEEHTVFDRVRARDPEGQFFHELVADVVVDAIQSLPSLWRETLVLRDMAGLSYAEIAEVVGGPVGTVKSRLFRARQALQGQLFDYALEMGYIGEKVA
jgi:RNA polymerase sigma-70 factor (ECF subfamily)